MPANVSAAIDQRAGVVHDAAGAVAHVFEPDRHGKPGADLQRELAERAGVAIDVAAVHVMADFEERGQHREQDRRAVHHPATAGRRRACAADGRPTQNEIAGTP